MPVGQWSLPWSLARTLVGLLLVALTSGTSGCKSIYRQTHGMLPPDPAVELRMRLDDARRAETLVVQAGERLHRDLKRAVTGDIIQVDFDRLESAAFELERRSLVARESLERCVETAEHSGQIESLQRRAGAWRDFVQANRQADFAAQMRQLDALR